MPEQLPLAGLAPSAVAVDPRAVRRHARKRLAAWGSQLGFAVCAYLIDVALLDELRARYRAILRDRKRKARKEGTHLAQRAGRAAVALAASPEGRKIHRMMQEVSERVQMRESALCG